MTEEEGDDNGDTRVIRTANRMRAQKQAQAVIHRGILYVLLPAIVTGLALASAAIVAQLLAFVAYDRRIRNPETQLLPDILLDRLPHIRGRTIADSLVYTHFGLTLFVLAFLSSRPLRNLRRLLLQMTIIILLRSMTVFWTAHPDPSDACAGAEPLGTGAELARQFAKGNSCGDLMFSGHTATALLSSLALYSSFEDRKGLGAFLMHVLSLLLTIASLVFIFLQRLHNTEDVAVSIEITCLVWISMCLFWREEHNITGCWCVRRCEADRNIKGWNFCDCCCCHDSKETDTATQQTQLTTTTVTGR